MIRVGVYVIFGTALMVLGITFLVFLFSAMVSAMKPFMAVSTGTISRMLRKLDPIAIIERRS